MQRTILIIFSVVFAIHLQAQSFYFGADMSYVNEMEDCGVTYFENQEEKDPYAILENNGGKLVRLRLWHAPSWYDQLNSGNRYSDLNDVKRSIARAKQQEMDVLLDFHLSDNWADPSKQLVPAAWLSVVDDIDLLKDSLYNYIHKTLSELNAENLLPKMVQVGNETNKGILLSPEDNAVWTLDWERNAELFNSAIQAIEDVEAASGEDIKIMLHVAGPDNAEWLIDGFVESGVTKFDAIGISYYWAWHKPTTIKETGEVIQSLRTFYPNKEVIIVETGYIWTTEWNDSAGNIISETHPDYHPASPTNQRDWLIELTEEVMKSGGTGVLYWEPFWVSSGCSTQWGQGSHQEHATFFDFDTHLILPGGIEWMSHPYSTTSTQETEEFPKVQILSNSFSGDIKIKQSFAQNKELHYSVMDTIGNTIVKGNSNQKELSLSIANQPFGIYVVTVRSGDLFAKSKKILYSNQ